MKILFIAHRIPYPPNKGDKIRSFNEIKYLSKMHSIYLYCFVDMKMDLQFQETLRQYCEVVHVVPINKILAKLKALLWLYIGKSFTCGYFFSRKFKKLVLQSMKKNNIDRIIVFSSGMAQYVKEANNIPKVIDFVDVDSDKWKQYAEYSWFPLSLIYKLEAERLRKEEKNILQSFNHCVVTSSGEKDLLKKIYPEGKVHILSNGVDMDFFRSTSAAYDPSTIVFTGAMDYFPNIDGVLYFVNHILPLIKKQRPETMFYIVGNNPPKKLIKLMVNGHIRVTGYVPDIRPYIERAAVSVVPLRIARGIQNKILESMAMGTPVVATSIAFSGIQGDPYRHLFVEDDAEKFADKVLEVMNNENRRKELSAIGREIIEKNYNWSHNLNTLEKIMHNRV